MPSFRLAIAGNSAKLLLLCSHLLAFVPCASSQVAQDASKQNGSAQTAPATPQDPSFAQATRLLQQGKTDEALALLEGVAASDPSRKGLARELGFAYYRKGDYMKAAANFQKALQENPGDNEAVQLMGLSYYLAGRPAEAIGPLEKVQTWYPSANVDASYILGVCYIQTKDYPSARKAFAKMFGTPPDSAASYLFTARMLLRHDFDPIAEEYGKKAVELDPKLPLAHALLGEIYLYKSRVPEAIEQLQKELELNPGEASVYYKLADAYTRSQNYEEAEKLLQRSVWLDPSSTGPYILMGKVLAKKGEPELAVRSLQRALAMDPNNPIPHHLLGMAYRDLGRTQEAEQELKLSQQLQDQKNAKP